MVPRPPKPIPPPLLQTELVEKKRKRDKKGGKGFIKEGEVQEDTPLKPTKVAKPTRAQQRRGRESLEAVSERQSRVPSWNPFFVLDGSPLPEDSSICNFDNGGAGYVADSIEQALLLPRDMDELYNLKKHKLFLSIKRNLALVRPHSTCSFILATSLP